MSKDPIPKAMFDRWQGPAVDESKASIRWWLPSEYVKSKCYYCPAQAKGHTDRGRCTCCEKCAREPASCKCAFNEQQTVVAEEIPLP